MAPVAPHSLTPLPARMETSCWTFFHQRKLDLLLDRVATVNQNVDLLSEPVGLTRALANDLAGVFVEGVTIVDQGRERNEAFDEEIGEFDKKTELGHADDEAVKVLADAVL